MLIMATHLKFYSGFDIIQILMIYHQNTISLKILGNCLKRELCSIYQMDFVMWLSVYPLVEWKI